MTPSNEQKAVLAAFVARKNIKISAVAGSGKSTTLLLCAKELPKGRRALLLTYNKSLEAEVKVRVAEAKLDNVLSVRTYHGAASAAYGQIINTDVKFRNVSKTAPESIERLGPIDVLFLDEAQDMTIDYFALVRHIIEARRDKKTGVAPQLVIVGDEMQAINRYKGARVEFLTQCERVFANTGREWVTLGLRTTYRLTPAMAGFVNTHVIRSPLLIGGNTKAPNIKPTYISCNPFAAAKKIACVVADAVQEYGATEVAIIAATVRNLASSQSPLAKLVREHLAENLLYVSDEEEMANKSLAKGKLLITTFNSMKGCERDCVIVMNFDESYFMYNDKEWGDRPGIPNVLYVAATRAKKRLVIVADPKKTLRTVDVNTLGNCVKLVGSDPNLAVTIVPKPGDERTMTVTAALRHLSIEAIVAAMECVTIVGRRRIASVAKDVRPPFAVHFDKNETKYGENVAALYGTVIPAFAEVARTGRTEFGKGLDEPNVVSLLRDVRGPTDITRAAYAQYPEDFWSAVAYAVETRIEDREPRDWFRIAVALDAMDSGRHHIARQILNYDWVSMDFVDAGAAAIGQALGKTEGVYEKMMPAVCSGSVRLVGRADFVAKSGEIWEFKCADDPREEYILQLACYLAMSENDGKMKPVSSGTKTKLPVLEGKTKTKCTIVNGVIVNGSGANGTGVNGSGANGTGVNGSGANGTGVNGSGANGTGVNGRADGTEVKAEQRTRGHLFTYLSGEIVTIELKDSRKLLEVILTKAAEPTNDILEEIEKFDAGIDCDADNRGGDHTGDGAHPDDKNASADDDSDFL